MKKIVFTLITALLFSFNCFSQENNDIFTSVKYIELRDYYIEKVLTYVIIIVDFFNRGE